ncbi:MAG: RelA/SpoT family protein [Candidatus Nealsonbacteria bacterium]|nr:RelA/SpoT family protein [Candidatus Nealsonbacteria bacterium]
MAGPQIQYIIKQSSEPELIKNAFEFAEEAHQGQKRASGEGYIFHPLRVANTLSAMKLDSKTVAAGLLHDIVDDTDKTLGEIEEKFGKEISFLVNGVSKLGKLRYPKEELTLEPIEMRVKNPIDLRAENLRKMFFAMAEDLRVVLIKLADRLDNMETLGSIPPKKQQRIALETLEIFAPLANRLGIGDIRSKLQDLAFMYLYPKEYEWLLKNVQERYETRKKYLEKVKKVLTKILKKEGIKIIDIHFRPKHYWTLYQKLLKHEKNFDRIYDLVALRIIVKDIKNCYGVLGIIHKFWRPLPGRIKDYIAFPKPNGYQALHTTCFCLNGKIIEIQIKTQEMHDEAEYGITAHWAMKEGINLKSQRKNFAWVQQLKDWQKKITKPKDFLEGLKIDFFRNRIFIFTPKGDVIDLPEGACPIDFAYAVHSEIGNRCSAAKINGKITQLSRPLKNGDVVEIIIDKNKKPSKDWLKYVKTSLARSRIKNFLKQDSPAENLKNFLKKKVEQIRALPKFNRQPKLPKKPKTKMAISLSGHTDIRSHLAKCCSPKEGDELKAYITQNHTIAIHKADCKDFLKLQKKWPQKTIEAKWKKIIR